MLKMSISTKELFALPDKTKYMEHMLDKLRDSGFDIYSSKHKIMIKYDNENSCYVFEQEQDERI